MKFYFYFSLGLSFLGLLFSLWALKGLLGPHSGGGRGNWGALGLGAVYAVIGLIVLVVLLNGIIASVLSLRSDIATLAGLSLGLNILPIIIALGLLATQGLNEQQSEQRHQLRRAVQSGDVHQVSDLLKRGQSPNLETPHEGTLLQMAAQQGNVAMMRVLVDAKAGNINEALGDAAQSGQQEAIAYLLSVGADVNDTTHGTAPLMRATSLEAAQALVEAGADIHATGEYGEETALMLAVREKHEHIVRYLLDLGADVHAVDDKGQNALHYASYQHGAIIHALLDKNVACTVKDQKGQLALHAVFSNWDGDGHVPALPEQDPWAGARRLIECSGGVDMTTDSGDTVLMRAAAGTLRPALLDYLLSIGANINTKNNTGKTALMMAVKDDDKGLETITYLLAHGASVPPTDTDGNSALHLAATRYVSPRTVETLLGAGADANQLNNVGLSAFMSLMHTADLHFNKTRDSITAMLAHGADLNITDPQGDTAVMVALARPGYVSDETYELLIDAGTHGANDKTNNKGQSAMMMFMAAGKYEAVIHLLDKGALSTQTDKEGNNMFHYLAKYERLHLSNRKRIADTLQQFGVALSAKNNAGKTPLDIAREHPLSDEQLALFSATTTAPAH